MGTLLYESASLAGDYVSGLLQAALALALVAAFAFLVLRFTSLRALLAQRGKLLSVEESLRLDPRNNLLIVRVEQRRLLIATHTDGAAQLLAELPSTEPAAQVPAAEPAAQALSLGNGVPQSQRAPTEP
jgi:flagellar biogenesis protein FliO